MLVSLERFYGLPEDQKTNLEKVMQATVTALYKSTLTLSERIPEGGRASFGDADYSISKRGSSLLFKHNSSGWWAWIRWCRPHADHPVHGYRDWIEFEVFSRTGAIPQRVMSGDQSAVPKWLQEEFQHGRADLFFKALRTQDGWSSDLHNINLYHPLLFCLRLAVERGE